MSMCLRRKKCVLENEKIYKRLLLLYSTMKAKATYALFLSVTILLMFPFVAALETPIIVETLPNHQVTVNVLNPSTGDAHKSLEGNTNAAGSVTLTYASNSNQKLNFYVIVRTGEGKIVLTKQFEGYETGTTVTLKVTVDTPKTTAITTTNITPNATANETPKNTTPVNLTQNLTRTQNATDISATSTAVGTSSSAFASIWDSIVSYRYIISIIIILILLALIIIKFWSSVKRKIDERRAFLKSSGFKEKVSEKDLDKGSPRELLNAERKLRQLQEEIDTIKNKNRRILEAERKYEEAKREFERLRRE